MAAAGDEPPAQPAAGDDRGVGHGAEPGEGEHAGADLGAEQGVADDEAGDRQDQGVQGAAADAGEGGDRRLVGQARQQAEQQGAGDGQEEQPPLRRHARPHRVGHDGRQRRPASRAGHLPTA
jgi:hypothetical protein